MIPCYVEGDQYMLCYIFHQMRTAALNSGIRWSSYVSNIKPQPAAQSITQTFLFFPPSVWTKATWVCVWDGKFYYLCYSSAVPTSPAGWYSSFSFYIQCTERGEQSSVCSYTPQQDTEPAFSLWHCKLLLLRDTWDCIYSNSNIPVYTHGFLCDKDETAERAEQGFFFPSFPWICRALFDLQWMTSRHRRLYCLTGDVCVRCVQLLATWCYCRQPHGQSKLTSRDTLFPSCYFLLS